MSRQYFLDLAAAGKPMPIGTDLVLQEHPDAETIITDGSRLGQVVKEAACRYGTPLAFPLMDLKLEKRSLLGVLGITSEAADSFHFDAPPSTEQQALFKSGLQAPLNPRLQAHIDSVAYIAGHTNLLPIGMSIGPFSLTTKLLADPITPIFLAGSGFSAEDESEILTLEAALDMATQMVLRSLTAQIEAGARAVFIAEPAANSVFFSPKQIEDGADTFERYVMAPNRRIKALLDGAGVDLIFHCCGELTDDMVRAFATLHPVVLSLGSSRQLWHDATLVPDDIVLYGNLPTKKFYSDSEITRDEVERLAQEILDRVSATGHPFILGSECDVLSVPGCQDIIRDKVQAFMHCACH